MLCAYPEWLLEVCVSLLGQLVDGVLDDVVAVHIEDETRVNRINHRHERTREVTAVDFLNSILKATRAAKLQYNAVSGSLDVKYCPYSILHFFI